MEFTARATITAVLALIFSPAGMAQEREITRYLRSYEVPAGQTMDEVVCIGCSVTVAGTVTGDVVAVGGDIDISGTVGGDAVAAGGRIRLRPGSKAAGDVVTVGGTVQREGNVSLGSEPDEVPFVHLPGQRSLHPWGVLTLAAVNILVALIAGGLLRPRRLENIVGSLRRRSLITGMLGLLLSAAWVFLWFLPETSSRVLQVILWIAHGALLGLLLAGCAGLAWAAGRFAFPKAPGAATLVSGSLIWTLLLLVPVAGTLVFVVAVVLGLGAAVKAMTSERMTNDE